jgi:ATP-binding cassette, subfamily B, bacterial HlyB/CyaB
MAAIRAVAAGGAARAAPGPAEQRVSTAVVCLAHALSFHDLPADPDALVHEHAIDKDEVDDALLLRMARERGLKGRVARMRWPALVRLGEALPAIARLTNGRCVLVVRAVEPETPDAPATAVAVLDPLATGSGLLTLDRATFEAAWDGTVVLLRPEAFRDADGEERQPFGLRWFVPEIVAQRSLLRDVALAAVVLQVLGLAGPIFFQLVVDKVLLHGSVTTLAVLVVGVAIAGLFEGLFSYLRELLLLFATNRIDIRLAKQTFAKLMSLPLPFFEQHPVGRVVQHMQQTEQIRQFLTGRLFFAALDGVALFVFVPFMWFYSPTLTLLTLGFTLLIALVILGIIGPLRRRMKALYDAEGKRQSFLVETVHGMRTVKSLALEPLQRREWERRSARAVRNQFSTGKLSALADASVQFIQTAMTVGIVAVGALEVFSGAITLGALIAIQMMSSRVIQPLVQIVALLKEYQETAISIRMLGKIMNAQPEGGGRRGTLRPALSGTIRFENVTFRYPGRSAPALCGIDMEIARGATIGVMGRSGSGKTTLTRLVQGLYHPDEGHIRIDGHDVRDIDLGHLRRQIGVVLQDNFLFRGTVRDNIAATRPGASLAEVVRAARMAGADEFIERLPQGYETFVDENGANLSGGQKQRIAIARALLPEPAILIFDEATSALDPESEAIVQANLADIAAGRTTIIISHRLSTIAGADTILVMDQGRLTGAGTHQELIRGNAVYRQLWQQQARLAAA